MGKIGGGVDHKDFARAQSTSVLVRFNVARENKWLGIFPRMNCHESRKDDAQIASAA